MFRFSADLEDLKDIISDLKQMLDHDLSLQNGGAQAYGPASECAPTFFSVMRDKKEAASVHEKESAGPEVGCQERRSRWVARE